MGCARRRNAVAAVLTACLLQLDGGRGWLAAPAGSVHQRKSLPFSTTFWPGRYDVTPTGTGTGTGTGRRRKRQHAAVRPLFAAASTTPAETAADSAAAEHQRPRTAKKTASSGNNLQSVDFTTALVMSRELEQSIVPARVENAYQMDAHNVALQLRTLDGNMWLHVCWHPKGAR